MAAADVPLILASASPRRKALLEQVGLKFRIHPSTAVESVSPTLAPREHVKVLAYLKAKEVAAIYPAGLILGADTIVVVGARILGKPKSQLDAARMLRLLSGKTHKVLTGIALLRPSDGKQVVDVCETAVRFRKLTREDVDTYVKSGEPQDKAGAYAAQGRAAAFIERIEGDFYNVVGLPISRVLKHLAAFR